MIKLGEIQSLVVLRKASVGAYLNVSENSGAKQSRDDDVLLPNNQLEEGIETGDTVEVFVYKDSEDRLIATRKKPYITLGKIARLAVLEKTKIGAFLDWGLEKDLLLPFKEQTFPIEQGEKYLVWLYVDLSDRLCATMNLDRMLQPAQQGQFRENQWVNGVIYRMDPEYGAVVAVESQFEGVIPEKELHGEYSIGKDMRLRVKKIRQNGKVELSIRKEAYFQMNDDGQIILNKLAQMGGELKLSDKSSPDEIKAMLGMSKASFKRAIGKLYKERKIVIEADSIVQAKL